MTEPHVPEQGGTPPPSPAPQKRGNGCITALLVCIIASFVIVGVFIVCTLLSPPTEYKALDYSAVLTNPDLYSGELARLEAVMIDRIESPDKENTWFLVSEPDHDDHVWVVCGPLPASEAARLEAGVGVMLRGVCAGTVGVTVDGREDFYPAIRFSDCSVGVQTGHSSNYLFERRLERVKEDVRTRDLPDEPHQYTLSAGHYWVQTDIPGGSCTVTRLSGEGNVLGEAYDETFFVRMGDDPNAENRLELAEMTSGWLTVCGPLTVTVEYANVSFPAAVTIPHPEAAVELTAGTFFVDDLSTKYADYILTAVSGSGEVICGDPEEGGLHERMSANPQSGEIPSFHHLEMGLYDVLKISGDLVLRFTPLSYDYAPLREVLENGGDNNG